MENDKIEIKQSTIIKLNKKNQRLEEINKKLRIKVNKQKEHSKTIYGREDFLKCEILKLNPKYKFDDSKKCLNKSKIRNRDNNLCCFCKINIYEVSQDSTLHHKIPKRYGGSDKPKNLITICEECHVLLEELINIVEVEAIKLTKTNKGVGE